MTVDAEDHDREQSLSAAGEPGAESAPDVAVIIPVYNGETHIADALASIEAQTLQPAEVVVVDDGSTDGTAAVASAAPGVRVVRQANSGPGAARDRGLRETASEIVVFLDADDLLLPRALEVAVTELQRHPTSSAVAGRADDGEGRQRYGSHTTGKVTYPTVLAGHSFVPPSSLAIRRQAMDAVGGWPDRRLAQDLALYLRLAEWGPVWAHGHHVTSYRRHADNSTNDLGRLLPACLEVLEAERPRAAGDAQLEMALEQGKRKWIKLFGPMLPASAARQLVSGDFRAATRTLAVALRLDPTSLFLFPLHMLGRVVRSLAGRCPTRSNGSG